MSASSSVQSDDAMPANASKAVRSDVRQPGSAASMSSSGRGSSRAARKFASSARRQVLPDLTWPASHAIRCRPATNRALVTPIRAPTAIRQRRQHPDQTTPRLRVGKVVHVHVAEERRGTAEDLLVTQDRDGDRRPVDGSKETPCRLRAEQRVRDGCADCVLRWDLPSAEARAWCGAAPRRRGTARPAPRTPSRSRRSPGPASPCGRRGRRAPTPCTVVALGRIEDQAIVGEEWVPAPGQGRRQRGLASHGGAPEGVHIASPSHGAGLEWKKPPLQGQRRQRGSHEEEPDVRLGKPGLRHVPDVISALDEQPESARQADQLAALRVSPSRSFALGVRERVRHRAAPNGHVGAVASHPGGDAWPQVEVGVYRERNSLPRRRPGIGAAKLRRSASHPRMLYLASSTRPASSSSPRKIAMS